MAKTIEERMKVIENKVKVLEETKYLVLTKAATACQMLLQRVAELEGELK